MILNCRQKKRSIKQDQNIIFMFIFLLSNTEKRNKRVRVAFHPLVFLPYPRVYTVSGKWQNIIPYLEGMSIGFFVSHADLQFA